MGFSPEWLARRESADHAARDQALMQRAADLAGANPVVLDLGSGTGSTVRAMGPALPTNTTWHLVDSDEKLLDVATVTLQLAVQCHPQDLRNIQALPLSGVTLVTASALLDLVSHEWVVALASTLLVPFYAALSYNGQMAWNPPHPDDEAITAAFNRHQQRDKGFGRALGPDSVAVTEEAFVQAGFRVSSAESVWRLGPPQVSLHRELVRGIADAVSESDSLMASRWREFRVEAAPHTECLIGHGDLLAEPGRFRKDSDDA